ncbi:hypothetical protein NBRC116188_14590 [Oceaniserpentilla sp. 4NH20-0058]|uniref:PilN domain-containing protein n=1 Tax=Oceaniserpentilla sp. 4NH20-0058 TaxID=3127660 RepID=UPI0031038B21
MQQVNLYLEEFRKIEPEFSASIIVIINFYVLVIGLFVFVILSFMSEFQYKNQESLKEQTLYWENQLNASVKKFPEPETDKILLEEIKLYENKKLKNRNILSYLKNKELDNNGIHFSSILTALTNVNSKSAWLTKLRIRDSGKNIELTGYTIESNGLSEYIEKLSSIKELKNFEFETFNVSRNGEYLEFKIGSQREGESNEGVLENISLQN